MTSGSYPITGEPNRKAELPRSLVRSATPTGLPMCELFTAGLAQLGRCAPVGSAGSVEGVVGRQVVGLDAVVTRLGSVASGSFRFVHRTVCLGKERRAVVSDVAGIGDPDAGSAGNFSRRSESDRSR